MGRRTASIDCVSERQGLIKGCRMSPAILFVWTVFIASDGQATAQEQIDPAEEALDRQIATFQTGRMPPRTADGYEVTKLVPADAPPCCQPGIPLYYAGRYRDCRAQFESHRTVNPNDVENAAWHSLCVARAETPAKARAAL